jgi:hypothetical protein
MTVVGAKLLLTAVAAPEGSGTGAAVTSTGLDLDPPDTLLAAAAGVSDTTGSLLVRTGEVATIGMSLTESTEATGAAEGSCAAGMAPVAASASARFSS